MKVKKSIYDIYNKRKAVKTKGYSKYGNKKVILDGHKFDSQKEAKRYSELLLLEKAGEIYNLRLQPEYVIIPSKGRYRETIYRADFCYDTKKDDYNSFVVEDVKGMKTEVYKIKKKLMYHVYGILIKEI